MDTPDDTPPPRIQDTPEKGDSNTVSSYFRRFKTRICHGMPPVTSTLTAVLLLVVSVVVADNCTSGQPPIITVGPPPHRSYNDAEPIKLVCRAQGSQPIRFTWYKDGARLDDENKSYLMAEGTLKIRRALAETEGEYQCTVSNDCGTAFSNITRLERMYLQPRQGPPSQTRSQNNSVGNKVTMQCDQSARQGTVKVSFYWHKLANPDKCRGQGRRVKQEARINMDANGSLAFANLHASDEGMYKCFVLGGNGRHGAGCVRLTVDPNPHKHNLVPQLMYHSGSPQTGFQGEDFHLRCFFSGSPTPNVTFSKDGASLPYGRSLVDDVTHQLTIQNPVVEDSGYYVCRGQNEAGQSEPVRIAVKIYARPQIVEGPSSVNTSQGMRVVFACKGQGTPRPDVTWYKNTEKLPVESMPKSMRLSYDSSELEISRVRLEDRGTYHCNLSNPHGYVLTAAYLSVNENYVENKIHLVKERQGKKEEDSNEEPQRFTTSSVGYVIGAIVIAIILTVIVVLLVRTRKKSDSYNLDDEVAVRRTTKFPYAWKQLPFDQVGSPESYRLDTLGGDHAVGHRLLDEPRSTVTQV